MRTDRATKLPLTVIALGLLVNIGRSFRTPIPAKRSGGSPRSISPTWPASDFLPGRPSRSKARGYWRRARAPLGRSW